MPGRFHNRLVTQHHELYERIGESISRIDAAELELAKARQQRRLLIVTAKRAGIGVTELAREFGVTQTFIRNVLGDPLAWALLNDRPFGERPYAAADPPTGP